MGVVQWDVYDPETNTIVRHCATRAEAVHIVQTAQQENGHRFALRSVPNAGRLAEENRRLTYENRVVRELLAAVLVQQERVGNAAGFMWHLDAEDVRTGKERQQDLRWDVSADGGVDLYDRTEVDAL